MKSLAFLFLDSKAYIEIGVKHLVPKKKKGKKKHHNKKLTKNKKINWNKKSRKYFSGLIINYNEIKRKRKNTYFFLALPTLKAMKELGKQ